MAQKAEEYGSHDKTFGPTLPSYATLLCYFPMLSTCVVCLRKRGTDRAYAAASDSQGRYCEGLRHRGQGLFRAQGAFALTPFFKCTVWLLIRDPALSECVVADSHAS
eukprot:2150404-Rhodomonas_salina.1